MTRTGSVYGQGTQHRFLGPMCCVKPAADSTSRAHICGAGEAGLDRRVKPPPHVALTPRHGPQNYGSAGVSKKTIPVPSRNGGAPGRRFGTPRFRTTMARLQMRRLISIWRKPKLTLSKFSNPSAPFTRIASKRPYRSRSNAKSACKSNPIRSRPPPKLTVHA